MKCDVEGKYSYVSNTIIFSDLGAAERTDKSFREQHNPNHHRGKTPLLDLPIDMVRDFPVGDELHLLHLGLMKKLLNAFRTGKFGSCTKWSKINEKEIDAYLTSCKKPFEIHRNIRGLDEMARWKGTEFRTFLLYTSLVVLKKFLPIKYYNHYLLFYCAVVIMGSRYHCPKLLNIADEMIKVFLNLFKKLYGIEHFTSNLHNLSHLADEVRRFGVLGNFNTYNFENRLQNIKRMVRSGNMPLNQICKRILEEDVVASNDICISDQLDKTTFCGKTTFDCPIFKTISDTYKVFPCLKTPDFRINRKFAWQQMGFNSKFGNYFS